MKKNLIGHKTELSDLELKAKNELGWAPSITFKELVQIMVNSDFEKIKNRDR